MEKWTSLYTVEDYGSGSVRTRKWSTFAAGQKVHPKMPITSDIVINDLAVDFMEGKVRQCCQVSQTYTVDY